MGEQRKLKVQPQVNELKVQPVDDRTKLKILRWLIEDVKLLGQQNSVIKLANELVGYCRNGVLFADLLNKLAGREQVILGIFRLPKSMTEI